MVERGFYVNGAVRTLLLTSFALTSFAAATHAQNALPKPITRDSAGVRIIEYPTLGAMPHPVFASSFPNHQQLAKLPAAFRIDERPYLDLGGLNDDPKQEFDTQGPVSVVELSDGTIAASSSTRILMYARDGRFLRTVGREGDGPGEFRSLGELCRLRGDTILAIESGRYSIWNSAGKFLRTIANPHWNLHGSCTDTGHIVTTATSSEAKIDESPGADMEYSVRRYDGSLQRSLGKLPSRRLGNNRPMFVRVLPSATLTAFARNYELQFRSQTSGGVTRIVRLTGALVPVTEATWRQQSEDMLAATVMTADRKAVSADLMRRMMGMMPLGESFAPFSEILVDESSRVYVADYRHLRAWTVFGSDGMLLGRVNLPGASDKRSTVIAFRRDHLIARELDADGAVHVRFYRMAPITNR